MKKCDDLITFHEDLEDFLFKPWKSPALYNCLHDKKLLGQNTGVDKRRLASEEYFGVFTILFMSRMIYGVSQGRHEEDAYDHIVPSERRHSPCFVRENEKKYYAQHGYKTLLQAECSHKVKSGKWSKNFRTLKKRT